MTAETAGQKEAPSSEAVPAAAAAIPNFAEIHRFASASSAYSTTSDLPFPLHGMD